MDFSLLLILQRYEFSSKSQRSLVRISVRSSCCWYYKGTNFQANHNNNSILARAYIVVADTTKVRIFKQITTTITLVKMVLTLLLILQRYEFSSKSQHGLVTSAQLQVVADTTKVRIFKQITTALVLIIILIALLLILQRYEFSSKSQLQLNTCVRMFRCCWYYKGTNFQANHNICAPEAWSVRLLLILQRYEFSSKSQRSAYAWDWRTSCCWYYKGTNFQANHNWRSERVTYCSVVADTTKVRIFKQITTLMMTGRITMQLLLILQRYEFSSKSQQDVIKFGLPISCCWYYKGTNFQANHNLGFHLDRLITVVADTTKVRIFKQITTIAMRYAWYCGCCWYYKGTNFQANHNMVQAPTHLALVVADTTKVRIFKQITTRCNKIWLTN